MQITKYYCDTCKQEVQSKDEFYLVKIGIHKELDLLVVDSKEVCETCIRDIGYEPSDDKHLRYSLGKDFTKEIKGFFKRNS